MGGRRESRNETSLDLRVRVARNLPEKGPSSLVALLYQFCSFIFNMGLTPPPFLNNVKKKRLVQRGVLNKHLKQSRISMLIWQCFTHQRILILILHCNSAPKRGHDKSLLFFTYWIVGYDYSYGKYKWKSIKHLLLLFWRKEHTFYHPNITMHWIGIDP